MPQLDKVSYLSQFFWLTICFFSFYFVLGKIYLPKINRILKARAIKISSLDESQTSNNHVQVNNISGFRLKNYLKVSQRFAKYTFLVWVHFWVFSFFNSNLQLILNTIYNKKKRKPVNFHKDYTVILVNMGMTQRLSLFLFVLLFLSKRLKPLKSEEKLYNKVLLAKLVKLRRTYNFINLINNKKRKK